MKSVFIGLLAGHLDELQKFHWQDEHAEHSLLEFPNLSDPSSNYSLPIG
jgi:hypothetical protein